MLLIESIIIFIKVIINFVSLYMAGNITLNRIILTLAFRN